MAPIAGCAIPCTQPCLCGRWRTYFLMSANWLIGITWLALGLLSAAIVKDEEAALIEKFGDSYPAYVGWTGRFLPRTL